MTPDPNTPQPHAFCQNCGRPLDRDGVRTVGNAVYCEPCLAARLAGTPPPPAGGYQNVNTGPAAPQWSTMGAAPGFRHTHAPNPGTAVWLGFIPGVGAMYNEQYAKGLVHLLVFAVLVSFSHVSDIFGLFVAGWIAYMVIEAHHTAKARLEGTALPNPFGLNDIGERLGFGRAWPGAANFSGVAHDAAAAAQRAAAGFHHHAPPQSAAPPVPPQPTTPQSSTPDEWAAYTHAYAAHAGNYANTVADQANQAANQPFTPPFTAQPYSSVPNPDPLYGGEWAPIPPTTPVSPVPPARVSRFPMGAVWLIGLGAFFLLSTTHLFSGFSSTLLVACFLIGLGGWLFTRRMLDTGTSLTADGSPDYYLRLRRALRGSVWVALVGLLMLLDSIHLIGWGSSWPFFLIIAGALSLLDRTLFRQPVYVPPAAPGFTPATPFTPAPVPPAPQPGSGDWNSPGSTLATVPQHDITRGDR